MPRIRLRLQRRTWIAAFLAPILLAACISLLLCHEVAALAAPLLGPWAGYLLGHSDCTLAAIVPRRSYSLLLTGAAVLVSRIRVEDEALREGLLALLVLWSCIWLAAGVLSVLNTTS